MLICTLWIDTAASWAADAGSNELAGSGGRGDQAWDFFSKSLRVLGIQIYRYLLNAEAGEEEMEVEIHS